MADPFEVRMRFSSQLQHLNASVASAQKAAQYALKYRDLDEDLHSCILEQIERNNMNTRANIMYFIEHFLDLAHRDGHAPYLRMMQRDIVRVVDAVAPDDGSGAANVKVVRKVLEAMRGKGFFDEQTVEQIEDVIRERGTNNDDLATSPAGPDDNEADKARSDGTKRPAAARLDKRQVEQRIEEDRERHKRERESIWAVPRGDDTELNRLWEETSDYGEDDERLVVEEGQECSTEMDIRKCLHQRHANGNGA